MYKKSNSIPNFMLTLIFLITLFIVHCPNSVWACSSRTIPRARPSTSSSISATPSTTITTTKPTTTTTPATTTTTSRPNITFPTYKCPTDFDRWYCLNAATCFSIKIGESVMYNCECALGFMGPRCEYKELDGSYLPQRPRPMLEKASIASGAACALLFMFFICLTLYLRYDHHKLKCIDDDGDMLDIVNERCNRNCCISSGGIGGVGGDIGDKFDCRFCYESTYCCENYETDLLASAEKYRASVWRQYLENVYPLSFAIRRSTKL